MSGAIATAAAQTGWLGGAFAADSLRAWAIAFGIIIAAVVAGWVAQVLGFAAASRVARLTPGRVDDALVTHARWPARLIVPLLAVHLVLGILPLPGPAVMFLGHAVALGLIAGVAWLIIAMTGVVDTLMAEKYAAHMQENVDARRVYTQVRVLRQVITVVVVIVAAAAMLMTFPRVQQLGASLLASAGIIGVIFGVAATPALKNLIAGIQLALTQPVRMGDVVIVNNEFGRVEEIRATYVVVSVWDQRRLVVPLNWFNENIFENWTRTSSQLIGTVFLHVDYTVPVDEVRAELKRIVEASPLWDQRACVVQVTDATERVVTLRALVSAPNAPDLWTLRCEVRERLITFLRERHPGSLPKTRTEWTGGPPRLEAALP